MNTAGSSTAVVLGLKENWQQLLLLVVINAFVGGMVGLERTVVPLLAEEAVVLARMYETLGVCSIALGKATAGRSA